MSKGISNTEIEKSFKEINNDLNEYFLGVYPSDRFILCGEKNNKTTKTDKTLFSKG